MATARNRVIYQSEGLFVSNLVDASGSGQHEQLRRVQSANYSFTIPKQDINQYGELAKIGTINLETPTVSLDFTYYATDGYNERCLAFFVQTGTIAAGGFASGHLETSSGKNVFIATTAEGSDLNNSAIPASAVAIGIGNAYLSDYTFDAAVGSIPTVSVTMEGLNIRSDVSVNGENVANPAVNVSGRVLTTDDVELPQPRSATGSNEIIALKPGDIELDFGNFGTGGISAPLSMLVGNTGAHVQSISLSLPLSRTALEKLGSKTAYARAVDFPVTASLSVNAILNEIAAQNLVDMLDSTQENDITVRLRNSDGSTGLIYKMVGASLQDEAFSSSIGANKSVDMTFTTQIGGPNDGAHNIQVSGSSTEQIFTVVDA